MGDKRVPAPGQKRETEAVRRAENEGRNQGRELRIGGKRRAELSAESPGRKTRHHRKIALSRTHLFSIPSSSWPFHPRAFPRLLLPCTSRFFRPTEYIQIRFIGFLCYTWGHRIQFPISSGTHARLIFRKTRNTSLAFDETIRKTAFLSSNGESIP